MSLFNPAIWLGFLLALAASFGTGYYKGVKNEQNEQQLVIAKLNTEARQKEQALVTAVTTQATQLVKANNEAKVLLQKRNLAIDTGALKLRLPSKPPSAPYQPPTIPPLPPEIAFKQEPNLTQRLLDLLSPSPTKEMPTQGNSTPVSMPTTPSTKP